MKRLVWIAILLLAAQPLLAQQEEMGMPSPGEQEFGGGPPGPRGNRGWNRGGDSQRNPLERMSEVLSKAGVPLGDDQKKTLQTVMEEQRQAMRQAFQHRQETPGEHPQERPGESRGWDPQRSAQMRQQGEAFQEKLLALLTPAQQDVWKKYQQEQIRARGGYPALRLALEEAGAPPTPEQEAQLQEAFRNLNEQQRALRRAAAQGAQPNPVELQQLESQHLAQVAKLLNPAQRRALLEWRRNSQKQPN